jgi:hypothetical protein
MAQRSLDLIEVMRVFTEKAQPITGRGVGYKLFTADLIASMATKDMQRVYRLLKEARERGIIPWGWIVDETRELEIVSAWGDPDQYTDCVIRSYRLDYWQQQPKLLSVADAQKPRCNRCVQQLLAVRRASTKEEMAK